MTEQTNSRRPVVAALYREALPPRLAEIEELAEVRLTNVGRGELVHTGALTEALASGSIAGAALDVMHPEPLPAGHALWSMDNAQPLQNTVDKTLGFVPAS